MSLQSLAENTQKGDWSVAVRRLGFWNFGIMWELFQALGTCQVLKSIVTAGAMLYAVCLSILTEMLSGPLDLHVVISNDARRSVISS